MYYYYTNKSIVGIQYWGILYILRYSLLWILWITRAEILKHNNFNKYLTKKAHDC